VPKSLITFLDEHEDAIIASWVAAVQATSRRYADRTNEELRAYTLDAFGCVRSALRHGQGEIVRYVSRLASFRMRQGFSESETVLALLRGREVIGQLVVQEYGGEDLSNIERELDDVFHRIVAAYGQTYCALCTNQMSQDRMRAERRLESILEESGDAMVFFDAGRIVRSWNRGASLIFGYRPEEIVGRPMDVLVPEELIRAGEIQHLTSTLAATGTARLAETQRLARGGRRVWVDASYTTVRDPDGRPQGTWAIMRDLTERRRAQETQLQAERLALIGTMSAKLAHEIRNPLGSVGLNLDLLRDELEDMKSGRQKNSQESLGLLHSIEGELARVQRVIEDYLRFARLPSVKLRQLALNQLLEEHIPFLMPAFEQQGIRLQFDLAKDLPEIRADADQLWQALLNLIRNAIEAMPEGGTLTVATRPQHGTVVCRVRDTGHGMLAEQVEQIWKPFWSTKRGGTGLGMPLAQQIVAEHGGTLECESQQGTGTVFTMSLPVSTAVREPDRLKA